MGIPKLIQTLQPLAERVILGQDSSANRPSSDGAISNDSIGGERLLSRVMSVVIDGPSLIYHIYHRLLCLKTSQQYHIQSTHQPPNSSKHRHPILSQPNYSEINRAVLSFISYLQHDLRVEVQKIYFDGALPASKRDVRLARLEDGRRKLVEFRDLYPNLTARGHHEWNGCDALSSSLFPVSSFSNGKNRKGNKRSNWDLEELNAGLLFQTPAPLPASLKSLPAPPFMVPAAIEYLRFYLDPPTSTQTSTPQPTSVTTSNTQILQRPSALIQIVPGEADPYCAAHARRSGAAILTSDSDLLAYDLGSDGSVVFLNSLEVSLHSPEDLEEGEGRPPRTLLGMRYHAPFLTSKLGISCMLQRFCFHKFLDPSLSTSELKVRCRGDLTLELGSGKEEEWGEFQQQYSTDGLVLHGDDGDGDAEARSGIAKCRCKISPLHLQGLDPRVAELVMQFQILNPPAGGTDEQVEKAKDVEHDSDEEKNMHMYLPLLLEDPSRDSAWSYGQSIRNLAYTLLPRFIPPPPTASGQRRRLRIKEYQRRGPRIVGLTIEMHPDTASSDQGNTQIESLLSSLPSPHRRPISKTVVFDSLPAVALPPAPHIWKSLAISRISEQRILAGKAAPDHEWAERYLTPQRVPYAPTSWDDVHNQASVEAVLYSLRMLKQIARLCLDCRPYSALGGEGLRGLLEALESLPTLEELMRAGDVEMGTVRQDMDSGRESEGLSEKDKKCMNWEDRPQRNGKRATKKKNGSESNRENGEMEAARTSGMVREKRTKRGNMFAALDVDH
jgi:XPG domain containing